MKYLSILFILFFAFSAYGQIDNGVFSSSQTIAIRDATIADPYPSNVTVSGLVGTITDINVELTGLSHTWLSDIAILLVSPDVNKAFVLLSDCGYNAYARNISVTFDDQTASLIPCNETNGTTVPVGISSGSYRPISRFFENTTDPVDNFPLPAPQIGIPNQPAPTGVATLNSTFGGIDPNGVWSLYVIDKNGFDTGEISGGYSLIIKTVSSSCVYSITPTSQNIASSGAIGTLKVTTQTGCSFTSVSNSDFISIDSGPSGTGTSQVSFFVDANTGAARTGTIAVAGQIFTISQGAGTKKRRQSLFP